MSDKDYNPNMHTLEHLLNGTISEMLGCGRAFSTHIEKKKSKIDYKFNRNLTEVEVAEIQSKVNCVVMQGVDVTEEMMPIDKARAVFDLSRLPDSVTGDLRIVKVGEYDSCPCIGEHVSNTTEIGGLLKIISTDFLEDKGVLRVRFKIDKVG